MEAETYPCSGCSRRTDIMKCHACDFMDDVTALTGGEVTFEILPAGAVVGVRETLDAVDSGLVDGGFAWTHYWSGKHPAAMLFGSPVAGAGVGIDNIAFLSWFLNAGGKELYDRFGMKWA